MDTNSQNNLNEFIEDGSRRDKINENTNAPSVNIRSEENFDSNIQISEKSQIVGNEFKIIYNANQPLNHYELNSNYEFLKYPNNLRTLIISAIDTKNNGDPDRVIKFYEQLSHNTPAEIDIMSTFNKYKAEDSKIKNYYDIVPRKWGEGECQIKELGTSYIGNYYYIIMDKLPLTNISHLYKTFFNKALEQTRCSYTENQSNADYIGHNENLMVGTKYDLQAHLNNKINDCEDENERSRLIAIRKIATRSAINDIKPYFFDLLDKLDKIHSPFGQETKAFIHYDIKPENLLASTERKVGEPKRIHLIDWGSAETNNRDGSAIPKSSTPEFCIPYDEYNNPIIPSGIDHSACDIFSVCAVLYNIITTDIVYIKRNIKVVINNNETEKQIYILKPNDEIHNTLKELGVPSIIRSAICSGLIWNENYKLQTKTACELKTSLMSSPIDYLREIFWKTSKRKLVTFTIILMTVVFTVYYNIQFQHIRELVADRLDTSTSTTEPEYPPNHIFADEWNDQELQQLIYQRYSEDDEVSVDDLTVSKAVTFKTLWINEAGLQALTTQQVNTNNYFNSLTDSNIYKIYLKDDDDGKLLEPQNSNTTINSFEDIKKHFINLESIVLENIDIPDNFDTFKQMSSLKNIYIYNCNVTSLEPFKNAEYLHIKNCGDIYNIDGLESLTNVKHLTLNGFDIDLSGIENLENLEYLDLSGCTFDAAPLSLVDNEQIKYLLLDNITESTLDSTLNAISGYTRINTFVGRMNDYSDTCDKLTDILAGNSSIEYVYLSDSVFSDMSGFEKLDELASLRNINLFRAKNINREIWTDYTPFDDYITKTEYTVPANSLTDVYVRNWYDDLSIWYNGIESSKKDQLAHIVYAGYDTVAVIGKQIYFCHSDTSDDYTGDTSLVGNVENDRFGSRINTDFYDFFNHYNLPSEPSEESISSATFLTQLFPNVRRLILSDCRIPLDCPELRQLDKLEEIYVDSCGTVDMKAFVDMPSLTYIHISAASEIINVEALKSSEMGFVAKLEIARCEFPVCDIPLSSGIYALHLYQIDLSTADLEHLQGVSYINSIYLSDCSIDDEQALLELIHQDNINDILINNNSSPLDSLYNILSEDGYYICKPFYSYNNNDEPEEINGIKISK